MLHDVRLFFENPLMLALENENIVRKPSTGDMIRLFVYLRIRN